MSYKTKIKALEQKVAEQAAEIDRLSGQGQTRVTIAGGVVRGEYEQVKAVQHLILEAEKLRRVADAAKRILNTDCDLGVALLDLRRFYDGA